MVTGALAACASLAGLATGGGVEAGVDAGMAPLLFLDATHEDVHVADRTMPRDAREDAPKDAGADVDVARRDASTCDAAALPNEASIACPPAEAGSCMPLSLPGYTDTWKRPLVVPSACTTAQINDFVTDCLVGTDGGVATCDAFLSDMANATCNECMISDSTNTAYGALIAFGNYTVLNIGGCVDLLDPCAEECAKVIEGNEACPVVACASCPENASSTAIAACADLARECSCLHDSVATAACAYLASSGPTIQCYPTAMNGGFAGRAIFMGTLFCGPPDAGM